jgi:putative heme-binding domain-containing protein
MRPLLLLALLLPVFVSYGEIARWADATIPVTGGLELWFDATRENEAREAHYMNRLTPGQPMEIWHDSSGHSRHLIQWTHRARPAWREKAVAFDGDDYLASLLPETLRSKEFTVFLVAAPETTGGDFPALLSLARRDENDFTSGLTIDFGSEKSRDGTAPYLNVEGAGQSQKSNLLKAPLALRKGHVLTVTSVPGVSKLRADGIDQGSRERGDVALPVERVAVGARFVEPAMRHFYQGRLAEVLFFNRVLNPGEIAKVEGWLAEKHASLLHAEDANLVTAKDAPVVQMLVPGFSVEELPIRVNNLNNIEYARDGRVFAGGYDGRFHLLRDTDGDGLEDRLDTFSPGSSDDYPLGMVVKDGMPHALLADEIVRFRDTNGDGIPDKRETVVKGWDDPKLRSDPALMHRRVDSAMALAAGPDGSWYVTMGSANPGNGYWQKATGDAFSLDSVKTGPAAYSPEKRRGCLLRIHPDGKVEQLASGLRYIMSLQFDRHGELFATDQEGATWLPNGNPFDEFLHLQAGRHYGFPPRHPKLLPDVVDEPSVWNYAPQHESACGFRFNTPAEGRARFGPEFWADNAIVTGQSRGKLWRTALVKTPQGYVASNQLFARLGMLPVDCAISPQGDLVVCCHSGPPDWGSGPSQEGRLFKIRYVDPSVAQPVIAWAQNETTTVIQFDRPLVEDDWRDLSKRVHIENGRSVDAADRFEVLRPGYAVVRTELAQPRYQLPVKSAKLGEDARSIVIETAPRTQAVGQAITLDVPRRQKGITQANAIDITHDLCGLAATWKGQDGSTWTSWLPHPDPSVALALTRGSAIHEAYQTLLTKPGKLVLRTKLDLSHLLQPSVQPGSKLDYTPEPEVVTITLKSDAHLSLRTPGNAVQTRGREISFTRKNAGDAWQELEIELTTPVSKLEASFTTALDSKPRPLGIRRFLMPFATPSNRMETKATIPEIAGGNYENGRKLYHGKATCFTCHRFQGEGHVVGPDLSNSVHRDYASLLRDIQNPNASINPDAVAYQVELRDGGMAMGTRVGETADEIKFASPGGHVTTVKKSNIRDMKAMSTSLMPPGLLEALSKQEAKDLMTFLMTAPKREK